MADITTDPSGFGNIGGSNLPSTINPLIQSGAGIYDLIRGLSGSDVNNALTAAKLADPFMDQRAQYQQQLQKLLTDPNSFQTDPGYQFAKSQGLQAVTDSIGAASGGTRTGALPIGLDKYATGFAEQAYDTRLNQLATLSGATTGSPAAAGQMLLGGYANQDRSLAGGLTALSPLITSLLKGLSPGTGAPGLPTPEGILTGPPGPPDMNGLLTGPPSPFPDTADLLTGPPSPFPDTTDLLTGPPTPFPDFSGTFAGPPTDWAPDDFSWLDNLFGP